jgi:hypothetical protein
LNFTEGIREKVENSSRRIVYLDEEMYVYYEDPSENTIIVEWAGATKEIEITGSTNFFVMNYDTVNEVLYYSDRSSLYTVPSTVNGEFDFYPGDVDYRIDYVNSEYILLGNQFRSFKGASVFADGGIIVHPSRSIADGSRFYTYRSSVTETQGCTIKAYDEFDSVPQDTLVHNHYTCSRDYRIINGDTVFIELIDFNSFAGYVTITPDGKVHVMDFSESLPGFAESLPDFRINREYFFGFPNQCMVTFYYRDGNGESHYVATNLDLSVVLFNAYNYTIASKTIYADSHFRFSQNSTTEYSLYKDGQPFFNYPVTTEYSGNVQFHRYGDFGIIFKISLISSNVTLTRVNLDDGTSLDYDIQFWADNDVKGDYLLVDQSNEICLYDIINDEFTPLGVQGLFLKTNEDYQVIFNDDNVYLYDVANRTLVEMERIGHYIKSNSIYAFLVKYEEEYYIIG